MVNRKSARAKFCSPTCKDRARSADRKAANRTEMRRRKCIQCGGPIDQSKPTKTVCCSLDCRVKYENAKRTAAKRTANLAKRQPCLWCGSTIPGDKKSHAKYCTRDCMRRHVSERNKNPVRARELNRQRLYGIGNGEFDAMFAAQSGVCAVCKSAEWGQKGPCVDHDHATGKIRGILCGSCNNGLGRFFDDPARLRAAADYLERHTLPG